MNALLYGTSYALIDRRRESKYALIQRKSLQTKSRKALQFRLQGWTQVPQRNRIQLKKEIFGKHTHLYTSTGAKIISLYSKIKRSSSVSVPSKSHFIKEIFNEIGLVFRYSSYILSLSKQLGTQPRKSRSSDYPGKCYVCCFGTAIIVARGIRKLHRSLRPLDHKRPKKSDFVGLLSGSHKTWKGQKEYIKE